MTILTIKTLKEGRGRNSVSLPSGSWLYNASLIGATFIRAFDLEGKPWLLLKDEYRIVSPLELLAECAEDQC